MKKRMLCLLLALVMTLSLCVPALAADEFAAEAVTEVEEQAPVDPVAEDAAEAASIDEAVDVPEAIYIVDVTDTNVKALADIISKCDSDVTAVKNHTKMSPLTGDADSNWSEQYNLQGILAGTTGIKDAFVAAYDNAVALQKQMNASSKDDVFDSDVKAAIKALSEAKDALISEIKVPVDADAVKLAMNATGSSLLRQFDGTSAWFDNETNLNKFTASYREDYVEDLVAAIKVAEKQAARVANYGSTSVSDFWAALKGLYDLRIAGTTGGQARVPNATEAAELKKLIDDVAKKLADTANYVDDSDTSGATHGSKLKDALQNARDLYKSGEHSNDILDGTNYTKYKATLKELQKQAKLLKEVAPLAYLNGYDLSADQKSITIYVAHDTSKDSTQSDKNLWYQVQYSIDGKTKQVLDPDDVSPSSSSNRWVHFGSGVLNGTAGHTEYKMAETIKSGTDPFTKKSVIVVELYKYDTAKKDTVGAPVDTLTIENLNTDYKGPMFRGKAVYEATGTNAGKIKGNLTMAATAPYSNAEVYLAVNGERIKAAKATTVNATGFSGLSVDNAATGTSYVTKTDECTVQLWVTSDGHEVMRDEIPVTIPGLNTMYNANPMTILKGAKVKAISNKIGTASSTILCVADLQTVVDAVKDLGDLVMIYGTKIEDTASAKALLDDAVAAAEKAIADAAGIAYTPANKAAFQAAATKIKTILGYLTEAADLTELNAALATAKALNESDYTARSWYDANLAKYIKEAEDCIKTEPVADSAAVTGYNSSKQDDAADVGTCLKNLNDAMKKLEAVGADKAALNAAIAAAEALKEADYTAESWKDADLAAVIAAAKIIAGKDNAGKTEIDTAIAALTAAEAKLVKKDADEKPPVEDGPKAPASGTGWVLYNGTWYFFKAGTMVKNYWVGQADGASQWSTNWYYVGSDGKMATGMQYLDDLHGGYGWYFLQPTNTKGEIGKMMTGYQWVGGQYGECYFSKKSGESGKCTWSELLGNWNGTTWVK